ncbi:bifunctional PIG-L family deacetylase/class I SAM-dependent methyltransferase [Subtercola endophyticus]|uniref:bifunctional PIG-L family deacetylase/class I SAM-dependent methyltransferase n=1 Tax=Subtercola endophyticus TaxID=2895559 RepID=UPI001E355C4B|nr:bifunctional PIG-L family deacetylase/class I SAM-dependent methyltransferase [Subtercola endophyticus]UFS60442.1 PIG-L family deacetylase [Subtercola endophyticus]
MVTFDSREPGTTRAEWAADARWAGLPELTLDSVDRLIVVAAHPDDETLGAGGLIAECFAREIAVTVVIVTNGDASHPGSPTLDAEGLAAARSREVREAVDLLGPGTPIVELGFGDGTLADSPEAVHAALVRVLSSIVGEGATAASSGARTLLAAPWRGDEHPDHRVIGELCATLADEHGLELLEYPIWLWHWGSPDAPQTPWSDFVSLPLSDWSALSKDRAISAHRSQTEPLSPAPGDEALLHATFLANFDRDDEIFVRAATTTPDARSDATATITPSPTTTSGTPAATSSAVAMPAEYFDATYARSPDPWGFTDRWYEERKRAATLAALPRQRYSRGFEVGCSIGVLTEQLAPRVAALLSVDIAPAAVEKARERLAAAPNVTFRVANAATSPIDGPYDLIVFSEVGYYFTESTLDAVLDRFGTALSSDGHFIACHWRHPVSDYLQTGDEVHARIAAFAEGTGWSRLVQHHEEDFLLEVYSPDPRSVAAETGLV